jgi:hypothetical protein
MFFKCIFLHCGILISQEDSFNNKIALAIKSRFSKFVLYDGIILICITQFAHILISSKKFNKILLRIAFDTLRADLLFFCLFLHISLTKLLLKIGCIHYGFALVVFHPFIQFGYNYYSNYKITLWFSYVKFNEFWLSLLYQLKSWASSVPPLWNQLVDFYEIYDRY